MTRLVVRAKYKRYSRLTRLVSEVADFICAVTFLLTLILADTPVKKRLCS